MAKAKVGHLSVLLSLNAKGFSERLKRATSKIKNFGAGIAGIAIGVAKFGFALTAAAVGGISLMVRSSLRSIDALAKLSSKLGITTEALAGLQHHARLSGVGVKTLGTGLQRMTRRVSEAAKGTGEARAAIAELGLDAQMLAKLSPEKQFSRIADAMEQVASQGDKVRLTSKIFDSEGVGLINAFRGGSQAIQASRIEAEKLGLTVSRFEASNIEKANDSLSRLKGVFEGIGNELAKRFSPFITAAVNAIVKFAVKTNLVKRVGQVAFGIIAKGVEIVAIGIKGLRIAMDAWRFAGLTAIKAIVDGLRKIVIAFETVRNALGLGEGNSLSGKLGAFSNALEDQRLNARDKLDATIGDGSVTRAKQGFNQLLAKSVDPGPGFSGGGPGSGAANLAMQQLEVMRQVKFVLESIKVNTTETESLAI